MFVELFWFCHVSTYFSLVSNLIHNATRLSLSNEPFLFNKIICFLMFMMYLHFFYCLTQITHLNEHTLYRWNYCTKNYLVCFLFFSPKTMHDPMFSQGFLENQGLSTKTKIKLVFVLTRVLKIKEIHRKVVIHLEKPE